MRLFKRDNKTAKQAKKSSLAQDNESRALSDAELAEVSGGDKKAAPPPPPVEKVTIQFNEILIS